jgi:hypothetical protein
MLVAVVLFVGVAVGAPLISIDVSGLMRSYSLSDIGSGSFSGQVTASGANPPFNFSSTPPLSSFLGVDASLDQNTGVFSGQIFLEGDFGPFVLRVNDTLGNVAVSEPVFFSTATGIRVSTHFNSNNQCELGVRCTVKYQASSAASFYVVDPAWPVPPGMTFDNATGTIAGVLSVLGDTTTRVFAHYNINFITNVFMQIKVVPPIKLNLTFMQPTCGEN